MVQKDNRDRLMRRVGEAVEEFIKAEGGIQWRELRYIVDDALRNLKVTAVIPGVLAGPQ
jgi:UDP-N-acetylenolpyruvoylglucosamine reductase